MKNFILKYRLYNQQLAVQKITTPAGIVKWFCGIQAQDYYACKWAVGARLPGSTEIDFDDAVSNGEIIRTWPMRGTLHLVAADDIHWLFDLLAPQRIKAAKPRNRQLGLDDKLLMKTNKIIAKALGDGELLTREEISGALAGKGIKTDGVQLSHILHHAVLHKIICFGPPRDKQSTFVLLDTRVKPKKPLHREEALTELARRYFRSRGPATLQDFIWWSGLIISDARTALDNIKPGLIEEKLSGRSYFFNNHIDEPLKLKKIYLLPAFDEYLISYKDRSAMLDPIHKDRLIYINGIFNPIIVIDGVVLGMWKRIFNKNDIIVKLDPFAKLSKAQKALIKKEAEQFGRFLNKKVIIDACEGS